MRDAFKAAFKHSLIATALLVPFAAQAATAGPGTWSGNQTWAADAAHGGNLTGYYYWPATQPVHANGKRALVLVLHGCAQTAANDVINGTDGGYNWKGVADQYGAVVLAPNATGNVAGYHCWDYYGTSHSRTAGHPGVLLDLINRFKNDAQYEIDPNQVYVTGLSSGGGQTMVMGCLAPDVFAGIGNNAGPSLGTTSGQIGSVPSGYTATTAKNNCLNLAGSNSSHFSTQIASAIWGDMDFTVGQAYGPLNMDAMRMVYGGSFTSASLTVSGGGSGSKHTDANGKLRTSQIAVAGLSHAWPAGAGGQNTNYVNNTKVHYPNYIMDFWFTNNLRAGSGGGTTTTTAAGTTTTTAAATTTTTTATTTTTTVAGGACFNASNYAHVSAGRAYNSAGYAKANGSNQNMGLNNTFYTSKLRETGTNYYIIDSTCP
ncbi:PHB depolymerase family esterase [Noviherbaspirillum sedimenti]|uniref:Poly(3-hydroxybutyrate) depolymerase n=1 Tax=Noviherbaspirillum sedimenti TaxID=2320865 RepID=A0A3A3G9H5_9BURK|nr:PHB depolymerase family esterase [Noviherbaspirillum sedimenti]RJG03399.1 poly(3-hydroxybutyrate) depolymerase [Noviherbaspirillum sedimenti]